MPPSDDQPAPPPPPTPDALADLRRRIDEVDRRLIQALSERAQIVVEVGRSKRATGSPIYAPHRERQVLEHVLAMNPGPLPERTVEAIYRELMSGSFSLELPLRVGFLGPPGSFSHVAAVRHFGSSVEHADLHAIEHVFQEVAAGRCHYGLVPYENSIGGGITDTLDAFQQHEVVIYAEAHVEINQCLLANGAPSAITRIYSKPQAFAQCRHWLLEQFPNIECHDTTSTARAAQLAAEEPGAAAIGSELAGEIHGVKAVLRDIQDKPNNITRFLVIGREEALPSGDDRTTLMFVTANKPGALVDVLAVFRDNQINLSHIDKRPSGRSNWEYTFFIDADTHRSEHAMIKSVEQAQTHCLSMKVLGSYPRARRIL